MKRCTRLVFVFSALCLLTTFVAKAQRTDTTNYVVRTDVERRRAVDEKTNVYPMGIFVEFGGPTYGMFSINYDMRVSKRLNGLGFRVGVGFMKMDENTRVTVPVQLNYLLGKRGKYFEMGAGATFYHTTEGYREDVLGRRSSDAKSGVMGTLLFGYRKQPVEGGFLFSAGLAPIFGKDVNDKSFFFPFPYISFGYSF